MPEDLHRLRLVAGGRRLTLTVLLEATAEGIRLAGEAVRTEATEETAELTRLNNELATLARERARKQRELERTSRDLEMTLGDLRASYWHLRKIQEVLPFCMGCGEVKAGERRWQSFVEYLRENEILVSHSYCPECAREYVVDHDLDET